MKITLTGSLGHISKPLAQQLVAQGHAITIISSKAERKAEIEALGATAAIGSMEDAEFLTGTFKGSDVVYLMEAMGGKAFFDKDLDFMMAIRAIGNSYKQAVENSGVKQVVHLSSIGAHTDKGNGILCSHYEVEQILNGLPQDVSIKFMRPVGFYYNLLTLIPSIKSQQKIFFNYGGDEKEPWVSPLDIAAVIAEEIEKPFKGRELRYIASDEVSPNEIAEILGEAIGMPELKWQQVSDEQAVQGMLAAGMSPQAAKGLMEMNASRRGGLLYEDYNKHRPVLSRVKLKDYAANDFAKAFQQGQSFSH